MKTGQNDANVANSPCSLSFTIIRHHPALLHHHTLIMDRLLTFLMAFPILVLKLPNEKLIWKKFLISKYFLYSRLFLPHTYFLYSFTYLTLWLLHGKLHTWCHYTCCRLYTNIFVLKIISYSLKLMFSFLLYTVNWKKHQNVFVISSTKPSRF